MKEIYIGYWNNEKKPVPEYPFPVARQNVNNSVDVAKLEQVLQYKNRTIAYRGISTCRICGCNVGNEEHIIQLKTIKILIPSGYMHYVKEHGVELDSKLDLILDAIQENKIKLPYQLNPKFRNFK